MLEVDEVEEEVAIASEDIPARKTVRAYRVFREGTTSAIKPMEVESGSDKTPVANAKCAPK